MINVGISLSLLRVCFSCIDRYVVNDVDVNRGFYVRAALQKIKRHEIF
jgi:hypothetical protein